MKERSGSVDSVIVFARDSDFFDDVRLHVGSDVSTILVTVGDVFSVISPYHIQVNPCDSEDITHLFLYFKEKKLLISHILYLWDCHIDEGVGNLGSHIECLFHLSKAITLHAIYENLRFIYLHYPDQGNVSTYHSMAGGFIRTLNCEEFRIYYEIVGIDKGDIYNQTNLLLAELNSKTQNNPNQIVYRNGIRLERITEICSDELKNIEINALPPLRQAGIYLIVGGLNQTASILAEYLSTTYLATVILLDFPATNSEIDKKVSAISSLGGKCQYYSIDLANQEASKRVFDKIKQDNSDFDGVVYIDDFTSNDMPLEFRKEKHWQSLVNSKVNSLANLDLLTSDEKLDFLMIFSISSLLTEKQEQLENAVTNGCLDGYIEYRNDLTRTGQRSGFSLFINWSLDHEVNTQSGTDTFYGHTLRINDVIKVFEKNLILLEHLENANIMKPLHLEIDDSRNIHNMVNNQITQGINNMTYETDKQRFPKKEEVLKLKALTDDFIKELLSEHIGVIEEDINTKESFEVYGINSIMIVTLNKAFESVFGSLSKTLFFEYNNIDELAKYFIDSHEDKLKQLVGFNEKIVATMSQGEVGSDESLNDESIIIKSNSTVHQKDSLSKFTKHEVSGDEITENSETRQYNNQDIAIIGIDGRYPDASNLNQFWELLKEGTDCITDVPESHFDCDDIFDADPNQNKIYSRRGGFLDDVDKFDAEFFNISPREAELTDPQERLFLEVAWGAVEDAGYTKKSLLDSTEREVGVFVGAFWQPYQSIGTEQTILGNPVAPSGYLYSIANRVSYYFNLSGPSLAIDTACSGSLSAIHIACQSILTGDCKVAIAGGVNLSLHSSKYLFLSQKRFLSTDGRCRSFGEGGDGYVPGEGVGAILLKPMDEALKDRDIIYGVIKGSSINHGGKTHGYTVPSPNAQAEVIKKAHEKSGINPRTVSYVEAHGTGTSLGDPIEISGLNKAYRNWTKDKQFCAIGSVKSNIGHLEAAAGIAGITKVLLQMKHKQLVPSIHSKQLNSNIDFENSSFKIQRELESWVQPNLIIEGVQDSYKRRAGISSFGAGGVNSHIIIEEHVDDIVSHDELNGMQNELTVIILSALNQERLNQIVNNLYEYLVYDTQTYNLKDIAYTLQVGRETMNARLGFIVNSIDELKGILQKLIQGNKTLKHVYRGDLSDGHDVFSNLKKDKGFIDLVDSWVKESQYVKLLDLWTKGFDIDWNILHDEKQGARRVSLPTYPFSRERHWIDTIGHQKSELPSKKLQSRANQTIDFSSSDGLHDDLLKDKCIVYLKNVIASSLHLPVEKLDVLKPLEYYGMDSIYGMQIVNTLRADFPDVDNTLLTQYRTIGALAELLFEQKRDMLMLLVGNEYYLPEKQTNSKKVTEKLPIHQIASDLSNGDINFKSAMSKLKQDSEEVL